MRNNFWPVSVHLSNENPIMIILEYEIPDIWNSRNRIMMILSYETRMWLLLIRDPRRCITVMLYIWDTRPHYPDDNFWIPYLFLNCFFFILTPTYSVFSGIMFLDLSVFFISFLSFWSLHCLSFFELRILITTFGMNEFEFWCLPPLSTIFQLYHGNQF